jgi:predicted TIM-barrel fold metal-dependent hydrolase
MSDARRPTLPIKIDPTSNGEYRPIPLGRSLTAANVAAAERVTLNARRLGLDRRQFLTRLCGAATALIAFNDAFAAQGVRGGGFVLPPEAALDDAVAQAAIGAREFIFDVQTHMVDPNGPWRQRAGAASGWSGFLSSLPQGRCGKSDPVDCFAAEPFIKEVFLDSDTDMAVLSFVPALPEHNPLTLREAARTRDLVAQLGGGRRLLLHAMVVPNVADPAAQLAAMESAASEWKIAAWKVYTQWGPAREGWWLDDPKVGIPFIEKARALGIKTIAIHKGLSFGGFPLKYAGCADVGRVAKLFPDVTFLIYHAGYEARRSEGPYDPSGAEVGTDTLIASLEANGIPPNANVYAELGSTWRILMRDPTAAAHALGKLLAHVGQDRVLWGTDSIWYGSPQDQIQAFRAFQITPEFQEKYGYPALDPALKAKVFGLNAASVYGVDPNAIKRKAARDDLDRARAAYRERPVPSFATYGPRTDAEFDALVKRRGSGPP